MKFIVDANMVFRGILNTNGKIGDLLINSKQYFTFIAPEFLRTEICNHYPRLVKISGLTIEEIQEAEFHLYKDIHFISEEQIKISNWVLLMHLFLMLIRKTHIILLIQKNFAVKFGQATRS